MLRPHLRQSETDKIITHETRGAKPRWSVLPVLFAACFLVVPVGACTSLNNDGPKNDGGGDGPLGTGGAGGRAGASGNATGGGAATGGVVATGGAVSTGGSGTGGSSAGGAGGKATGGANTGGTATGGAATGGVATGGAAVGGKATGGVATGGVATGGVATGGIATGGMATGGVATGGMGTGGGTGGLMCTSGQMPCGSACANLQTSATSCGTCGHDCLGGTCSAGQCQPLLLGRYDRYLGNNGLSLGDSYVYARGEANIVTRAKKDGTSFSASFLPTFATSGCTDGNVAELNGRVVYQWHDGTSCRLGVCSPSDCDGTTVGFSPAGGASWVSNFGVDKTNNRVFWYDPATKRFLGATVAASGTPTTTTVSSTEIASSPGWTGFSSGGILYSQTSGNVSINRLPASGGTIVGVWGTDDLNLNTLWASTTRVYYSGTTAGIGYVALPTGTGALKSVTTAIAHNIWSDDVDIYWVGSSDSLKLMTCKVDNCATTTKIAFNSTCSIAGVRGEANAVYWGGYGACKAPGATTTDQMHLWKLAR